jgi:hypothetical protein
MANIIVYPDMNEADIPSVVVYPIDTMRNADTAETPTVQGQTWPRNDWYRDPY